MFEEILARIARSLERHGLPYMVIGGQAVLLYGEPRLTRDIDITLGVNIDHIDSLLAAIRVNLIITHISSKLVMRIV